MTLVLQKLAALALGLTIAGGIVSVVYLPEIIEHLEERELEANRAIGQSILDDAARNDGLEWAGEYLNSDGFEWRTLILGPTGYYFEHGGCLGIIESSHGQIAGVHGQLIRLEPDATLEPPPTYSRGPGHRPDFEFGTELYVVRWNKEQLIVPASQMESFCTFAKSPKPDSMQEADYPRLTSTDDRWNFRNSDLSGLPEVPAEFRHLLPTE